MGESLEILPVPAVRSVGQSPAGKTGLVFVWAHGWGQDGRAFDGIVTSLASVGSHLILDLPGFGRADAPPSNWGTADYADAAAKVIEPLRGQGKVVWVGHSFGGRVGIQFSARHPNSLDALILVASAGLPRKRSPIEFARYTSKVYTYKTLKYIAPYLGIDPNSLRQYFGSADYKSAGAMRSILLNVVREDLTDVAAKVACPTLLIYGEKDRDTPPEIGERLSALIKTSDLKILPDQDHYSLLGAGRHVVSKKILEFVSKL
ncbi:MAG: alpha/beta hydrolase [Rhodomicrobium sp.]